MNRTPALIEIAINTIIRNEKRISELSKITADLERGDYLSHLKRIKINHIKQIAYGLIEINTSLNHYIEQRVSRFHN